MYGSKIFLLLHTNMYKLKKNQESMIQLAELLKRLAMLGSWDQTDS